MNNIEYNKNSFVMNDKTYSTNGTKTLKKNELNYFARYNIYLFSIAKLLVFLYIPQFGTN